MLGFCSGFCCARKHLCRQRSQDRRISLVCPCQIHDCTLKCSHGLLELNHLELNAVISFCPKNLEPTKKSRSLLGIRASKGCLWTRLMSMGAKPHLCTPSSRCGHTASCVPAACDVAAAVIVSTGFETCWSQSSHDRLSCNQSFHLSCAVHVGSHCVHFQGVASKCRQQAVT